MPGAPEAALSTYRMQLSPGFGFAEARRAVPYLSLLGVTHLYLSPVTTAAAGSRHGYDVTDSQHLNPELGGPEGFDALVAELRRHSMGLLIDIVPNHMAASPENPWWRHVLANGRSSPYASYFDIEWDAPGAGGKLLLPVLGDHYGRVLAAGELALVLGDGEVEVAYGGLRLPVDARSLAPVLESCGEALQERQARAARGVAALAARAARLAPHTSTGAAAKRRVQEGEALLAALKKELKQTPAFAGVLADKLAVFGDVDSGGDALMDEMLLAQPYRLCHWKLAAHEINYRRFFDISGLAGVRQEDPAVFKATHALVLDLMRAGKADGLRVDHVDGLLDPARYLQTLAGKMPGREPWLLVEKILAPGEALPKSWPVSGTTGYEFGDILNRLFVDPRGAGALGAFYRRFTGDPRPFPQVALEAKREVLETGFAAEVGRLTARLASLAKADRGARDTPAAALRRALIAVTARLPSYRTYITDLDMTQQEQRQLRAALRGAAGDLGVDDQPAVGFLEGVLFLERPAAAIPEALAFVAKWQQLSGAAAAKGVEDTALYRHTALVSVNEVGADPAYPAASVEEFHRFMEERSRKWPRALSATSTHDSKRGEDVRARINVLSEMPEVWEDAAERWAAQNASRKARVGDLHAPAPSEELLAYQTAIGSWPAGKAGPETVRARIGEYMVKALREAKVNSSWTSPAAQWEAAAEAFVSAALDPNRRPLHTEVRELKEAFALYGAAGSLAQTVLKLAAPGIPDIYQGSEMWNLSLVDPDNRRPVDFDALRAALDDIDRSLEAGREPALEKLSGSWQDGRIKLHVTAAVLRFRRDNPELFAQGAYVPLAPAGSFRRNIVAFARRRRSSWAVAAAARLGTQLVDAQVWPCGEVWGLTRIPLPRGAPLRWRDVVTGAEFDAESAKGAPALQAAEVFALLPAALLAPAP